MTGTPQYKINYPIPDCACASWADENPLHRMDYDGHHPNCASKPQVEFAWSDNEEDFHGGYLSREEAFIEAEPSYDLMHVYTAKCVPASMNVRKWISGFTEHFLDCMRDAAYDDHGEHADGWLDHVTPNQDADLENRMLALFEEWMREHGHTPKFFTAELVQAHELREREGKECECGETREREVKPHVFECIGCGTRAGDAYEGPRI